MAPTSRSTHTPKPLPRVPGPKLAPFTPTARADIEFVEELGNPAIDMDSFVWKVRINGAASFYALKMFRFNCSIYLRQTTGRYLNRPFASPRRYIDYFDPFSCECRAYGRLNEESRQDLAIQAHGYLLLTPEQEARVAIRVSAIGPDRRDTRDELDGTEDPFGRMEEHFAQPVHAIVKDFAADECAFGPGQVGDMWRDLEDLHKLGILVRDIKLGNYLGGKLIDFSRSWTTPHPSLEYIHPRDLRRQRQRDPLSLEGSIIDLGMEKGWDWDEVVIPQELQDCASGRSEHDDYGTDPRLYDWRKWEENIDAVDAFFEQELCQVRLRR